MDLPGFGSSSKPTPAAYDAPYFARACCGPWTRSGSSAPTWSATRWAAGWRIEVGLTAPERVRRLGLLCPAVAWIKRGYHPLVRLLRPEFGLLPHRFGRDTVARPVLGLFADRDQIDPSVADVVVDEFQRIYGSAGARASPSWPRPATSISTRPFGRDGFYPRLAELEPPGLFVWCSHDQLMPAGVPPPRRAGCPSAEQIVLDDCGHVPQVERPEQTNGLLRRFFADVDALGARRAAAAAAQRPRVPGAQDRWRTGEAYQPWRAR